MEVIGQTINGYLFTEFIDQGGFGSVYKATKNGDLYAVKIFREDYILDEFRKGDDNRITREIAVIKNVNHPFLVDYIEHFKRELLNVPQIFLVMEYVDGTTLRNAIRNKNDYDKLAVFKKILLGLKELHSSNIIHRDLKPENIMTLPTGDIKILDYGLSKLIDFTSITSTGNILGTFAYMSPEQITDSKRVDLRSDLYSLGMIFYEMLTSKLPYTAQLIPEFIDKIKNELPIPPRKWDRSISNSLENITLKLLEKKPYKRYQNVEEVEIDLTLGKEKYQEYQSQDLTPRFILRTYNDKSVLEQFFLDHKDCNIYTNYPVNHQFRQKGLLKIVQGENIVTMYDPATIRLAYDTYTDVKGLLELSYCPSDYSVITPKNLSTFKEQKDYVKKVIDEQVKLKADILTSPYHYAHNTNIIPTTRHNPVADWFDLDVKLLKESLEYKNNNKFIKDTPLYAGICINALSLSDREYREELLNTYISIGCDGFIIYADGIDKKTTVPTLYNYIITLIELQTYSGKPVIAGRLDTLGLGLICVGITGFTSGAARFESFYEDLYKEITDSFNMYERYYFEDLLGTIAITRKDPVRLQQIVNVIGMCECKYCKGKQVPDLIKSKNSKLHFLEKITLEIDNIISINPEKRINYYLARIDRAIDNYKKLSAVFKPDEFRHLLRWRNVFNKIANDNV